LKDVIFAFANQAVLQGSSANYGYSGSAGEITKTGTASRQIPFALKLLF